MEDRMPFADDDFHEHVALMLDESDCVRCGRRADLHWAWDGIAAGKAGASEFAVRAVERLKRSGWRMLDGALLCRGCAAKARPMTSPRRWSAALRTLFAVVTLGVGLGWVAYQLNWIQQRGAVRRWLNEHAERIPLFGTHRAVYPETMAPRLLWLFGEKGEGGYVLPWGFQQPGVDRLEAIFPEATFVRPEQLYHRATEDSPAAPADPP